MYAKYIKKVYFEEFFVCINLVGYKCAVLSYVFGSCGLIVSMRNSIFAQCDKMCGLLSADKARVGCQSDTDATLFVTFKLDPIESKTNKCRKIFHRVCLSSQICSLHYPVTKTFADMPSAFYIWKPFQFKDGCFSGISIQTIQDWTNSY